MTQYVLKLYIAGHTAKAETAIANLRKIVEQHLGGHCQLYVIDVLEQPQLAEDDRVLATPTLIRQLPPPARRIVGDLSDTSKVSQALGLQSQAVP
jgi:circadian clock protein KaiB